MAEGRNCCIYLPNERKLELVLQPRLLGKDLLDIVASHFKLKEKEYFGLAYKSEGGHYSWLQDDKKVLEHDIARKSSGRLDFQFAIKFYVESITLLKHSTTIELFFLHIKSLIYKGQLDVDCETTFKLASLALQATCGNFVDEPTTLLQLKKLPFLPNKITKEFNLSHCENCVLDLYKEMHGATKGKSILSYLTCAETLPTYGIHYYKVKDKSGLPWWLGLSYKGILQYEFNNRSTAIKTFHWRQLENLYFREKKFSIEVNERHQKQFSSGSKDHLSIESKKKNGAEVKVHAWYGSPTLIKAIWIMSIAQHHFYLDRKQSKAKLNSHTSLTHLGNDLTNNNHSLITIPTIKLTPEMTKKQIREYNVTVKKGTKDETPAMRLAKREMTDGLKSRKTELEDRLYDKVQELKKLCLLEAEFTGKLPPEYVRYMDFNETPPKLKKRIGAEFKVKLRHKIHLPNFAVEKDFSSNATVTAASSSSSGFSSEAANDFSEELMQLETEAEILAQIANAAKKLASDPNARGRKRRMGSYRKTLDKLRNVEIKIDELRKKCGQKPSERASMLITDNDINFGEEEDAGISLPNETESERSSMSDGLLLDDDTSLSSGGDALSTHSTPAMTNHPASVSVQRKNPADVDISDIVQRSQTPPPNFGRTDHRHSEPNLVSQKTNQYIVPSQTVSRTSVDARNKLNEVSPGRNWRKWEPVQKHLSHRGWNESSLDSFETTSTTSRQSEDREDFNHRSSQSSENLRIHSQLHPVSKLEGNNKNTNNSNQNNHHTAIIRNGNVFSMAKLKREISESSLSELSVQSNPAVLPSSDTLKYKEQRKSENLPNIEEVPGGGGDNKVRKRSSSFTDVSSQHQKTHRTKPREPQGVDTALSDTYSVPDAFPTAPDQKGVTPISTTAQNLQPTIFSTNLNIRMQYLTKSSGQLSAPPNNNHTWTQAGTNPPPIHYNPHDPRNDQFAPQYPAAHAESYNVSSANMPMSVEEFYKQQHPAYTQPNEQYQQQPSYGESMTSHQRDNLNNEVYQDIGMGWVPSLYEYRSRASVCDTASVQSKKEDILRVLEDHINMKRTPSERREAKDKQRKMREYYKATQQNDSNSTLKNSSQEKSWAAYQKKLLTTQNQTQLRQQDPHKALSRQHSSHSTAPSNHPGNQERTNIFLHKPPPPVSSQIPSNLYKTERRPQHQHGALHGPPHPLHHGNYHTLHHPPASSGRRRVREEEELKQRILLQHYLHHDSQSDPLDHPRLLHAASYSPNSGQRHLAGLPDAVPASTNDNGFYPIVPSGDGTQRRQKKPPPPSLKAASVDGQSQQRGTAPTPVNERSHPSEDKPSPDGPKDTVVLQKLTKSSEGHSVSVFTVTKSAPNTPLSSQHSDTAKFFAESSSEDDAVKRVSTVRRQSADDLLNSPKMGDEGVFKRPLTPNVIVHTPSFKSRIKPKLVPRDIPLSDDSSDGESPLVAGGRIGRSPAKGRDCDTPTAPPRIKRALSKSRKKAAEVSSKSIENLSTPNKSETAPEKPKYNKSMSVQVMQPLKSSPGRSVTRADGRPPPLPRHPPATPKVTPIKLPPRPGTFASASPMGQYRQSPPTGRATPQFLGYSPVNQPYRSSPPLGRLTPQFSPPLGRSSPQKGSPPIPLSGTLPRSFKTRRKKDSNDNETNLRPAFTLDFSNVDAVREKKSRRSKSEVWRVGEMGQRLYPDHPVPMDPPMPHHHPQYAMGNQFQALPHGYYPPDPRYRVELPFYDPTPHNLPHKQMSASAEDLLWTDPGDNAAGTLV